MDKNLFLKNMEEMIQIAKTNGNQIDHDHIRSLPDRIWRK